ncbi:hypothetical protein [Marinobacter santoriniensis]|uniref:hypothetical protein n=1 Tax=Marinobacter santoriniensis TaxID=523742 RepID=UPI000593D54F|nr:hypothetical protein [Marinobacter santoriniensis]
MKKSINTYGYLYSASVSTENTGRNEAEGSFYQYMASLVFSAFTLEAYLNHLGFQVIGYWNHIESLSPIKKLDILSEVTGAKFEKGARPHQTVAELLRFRNEMAHGKSRFPSQIGGPDDPWWLEYCNEENASRAREAVEQIINTLNHESGVKDPWTFNHESY